MKQLTETLFSKMFLALEPHIRSEVVSPALEADLTTRLVGSGLSKEMKPIAHYSH